MHATLLLNFLTYPFSFWSILIVVVSVIRVDVFSRTLGLYRFYPRPRINNFVGLCGDVYLIVSYLRSVFRWVSDVHPTPFRIFSLTGFCILHTKSQKVRNS